MIVYINGNDNRCKYLAKLIEADGHRVETNINMLDVCHILYLGRDGAGFEQVDFKPNAIVITLLKNQRLSYLSKLKGFNYEYLYHDDDFVWENTFICDEALIAYMIIDNKISLANAKVLILGYGHCGRDLANKLEAFKAKITIANRNNHYFDEVIKKGYSYHSLKHLNLDKYDYVINTIPKQILTRQILSTKKTGCKIYDIASKPYGMNIQDRDENYHLLKQLPTKYAYQSSALVLYQAIKKVIDRYAGK